jgi:antitoxin component YwqK of YwqJK toxin-antitoxin module
MKKLLLLFSLVLAFNFSSFAQNELTLENPTLKVENKVYHLEGFDSFDRPILKYEEFREDGSLWQKGTYVDNKPDGIWYMYDAEGNVHSKMLFSNGSKVELTQFTADGMVVIRYVDNRPYKHTQIAYLD